MILIKTCFRMCSKAPHFARFTPGYNNDNFCIRISPQSGLIFDIRINKIKTLYKFHIYNYYNVNLKLYLYTYVNLHINNVKFTRIKLDESKHINK